MHKKNKLNIIYIVFTFMGMLFLVLGIMFCQPLFSKNYIATTATISRIIDCSNSSSSCQNKIYLTYEVNGKAYESTVNISSTSYYEGKEITIYYDTNKPSNVLIKSVILIFLIFPVFGLLFIGIGIGGLIFNWHKRKSNEILKETGLGIQAKYLKTRLNPYYRVNGKYPYKITCEGVNPYDNKKYIYESENIWFDPEELIKQYDIKEFTVYINSHNSKKYYVDISILNDFNVNK